MNQIIIHVDMDAFYASVEVRDDPALRGKPLIIGALPSERGVVATCSYETRKFGVHSGMSIKDAYRLCPRGIYRHPDFDKYRTVSHQLREIWRSYAAAMETIALDEAYLDVTEQAGNWEGAREIAQLIKRRTREELHLSCSVGLAYSKTAAKTASEEKKPDGYFEILSPKAFTDLIADRDVQVFTRSARRPHRSCTPQESVRSGMYSIVRRRSSGSSGNRDAGSLRSLSASTTAALLPIGQRTPNPSGVRSPFRRTWATMPS